MEMFKRFFTSLSRKPPQESTEEAQQEAVEDARLEAEEEANRKALEETRLEKLVQDPVFIRNRLLIGNLSIDPSNCFRLKNQLMIFISSTFEDTKFEQDALIQRAFPIIRELCAPLGLTLQVISMRWGVRNRSGNEHLTAELCMDLLEKCKKSSQGVAYATIQSHRYGFRPFPAVIKRELFENLIEFESENKHLLNPPYWKLDETSEPQVYRLQPINSLPELDKYLVSDEDKANMKKDETFRTSRLVEQRQTGAKWWDVFEKIQKSLRSCAWAAFTANLINEEELRIFFISVTHDEVDRGILLNDNRAIQSIYFERNIIGIDEEGLESVDSLNAGTAALYKDAIWAPYGTAPRIKDSETEKLQNDLKEEVKSKMPPDSIFINQVSWVSPVAGSVPGTTPSTLHPLDKRQSCEPEEWKMYINNFCSQFIASVESNLSKSKLRPDPLLQEVLHHRTLVQTKLQNLGFDRTPILDAIQQYTSQDFPHANKPFIVHGPSGTGKSWLMSHAINRISQARLSSTLIYRLLGTSRASSDVFELLLSLSKQAKFQHEADWNEIPQEWTDLKKWFASGMAFLQKEEQNYVVFLDSIDQLSSMYGPLKNLASWLPGLAKENPLPPNVRLVLSTLPEAQNISIINQLESSLRDNLDTNFMFVTPLTLEQATNSIPTMAKNLPARGVICPTKRIIPESHLSLLMELFAHHSSPLFLTVALSIMNKWPSYAEESQTVDLLRRASMTDNKGVRGLIELIFIQLEDKHGALLVKKVLASMTFCRDGMGREELEDIVSMDDEVLDDVFEWWTPPIRRCPPLLVDRIIFDLDSFIVERGASGGATVWGWYHRQFWEVSEERYEPERAKTLTSISDYFDSNLLDQAASTLPPPTLSETISLNREILQVTKAQREINPQFLRSAPSLSFDSYTPSLNVRKLSVLVDSLLCGNESELFRLGHLLTSELSFLMGLLEAGMLQELRHALSTLISKLKTFFPGADPLLNDLKSISKLIQLCIGVWCKATNHKSLLKASKTLPYQIVWRIKNGEISQPNNSILSQCEEWFRTQKPRIIPIGEHRLQSLRSPLDQTLSGHGENVCSVCQLSDGRLASGSNDRTIRVWNLTTGECELTLIGHTSAINCLCPLSDGRVASGSYDKTIRVWNLTTGECELTLSGFSSIYHAMCQLSDGRLASASQDKLHEEQRYIDVGLIRVWNLTTGECEQILRKRADNNRNSLSDGRLASASNDETIHLWNLTTGECELTLSGHTSYIVSVCQLSDGRLASCAWDRTVRVWNLTTGECEFTLKGHERNVQSVCPLSDGRVASASDDKSICVWNATTGECEHILKGHTSAINSVCQLSDGRLASSSHDKTVRVWNLTTGEYEQTSKGHSDSIRCVCQLSEHRLATGGSDKTICVWNLITGECELTLKGHTGFIIRLLELSDGRLASGAWDSTVRVWNLTTGECELTLKGHERSVNDLCQLSDGRLVVGTGIELSEDELLGCIFVWNLTTGECELTLKGHNSLSDGRLASGSKDVRVWNLTTGECELTLSGQTRLSDGRLVSVSDNKTIWVWNLTTGRCERALSGHIDKIEPVFQLSDGRLVSSSKDKSIVRVWDILTGDCLELTDKDEVRSVIKEEGGKDALALKFTHHHLVEDLVVQFDGLTIQNVVVSPLPSSTDSSSACCLTLFLSNHSVVCFHCLE